MHRSLFCPSVLVQEKKNRAVTKGLTVLPGRQSFPEWAYYICSPGTVVEILMFAFVVYLAKLIIGIVYAVLYDIACVCIYI